MNIKTCKFIDISDLVPEEWQGWFFDSFFKKARFSRGGKIMISILQFLEYCSDTLVWALEEDYISEKDSRDFVWNVTSLPDLANLYINISLEN